MSGKLSSFTTPWKTFYITVWVCVIIITLTFVLLVCLRPAVAPEVEPKVENLPGKRAFQFPPPDVEEQNVEISQETFVYQIFPSTKLQHPVGIVSSQNRLAYTEKGFDCQSNNYVSCGNAIVTNWNNYGWHLRQVQISGIDNVYIIYQRNIAQDNVIYEKFLTLSESKKSGDALANYGTQSKDVILVEQGEFQGDPAHYIGWRLIAVAKNYYTFQAVWIQGKETLDYFLYASGGGRDCQTATGNQDCLNVFAVPLKIYNQNPVYWAVVLDPSNTPIVDNPLICGTPEQRTIYVKENVYFDKAIRIYNTETQFFLRVELPSPYYLKKLYFDYRKASGTLQAQVEKNTNSTNCPLLSNYEFSVTFNDQPSVVEYAFDLSSRDLECGKPMWYSLYMEIDIPGTGNSNTEFVWEHGHQFSCRRRGMFSSFFLRCCTPLLPSQVCSYFTFHRGQFALRCLSLGEPGCIHQSLWGTKLFQIIVGSALVGIGKGFRITSYLAARNFLENALGEPSIISVSLFTTNPVLGPSNGNGLDFGGQFAAQIITLNINIAYNETFTQLACTKFQNLKVVSNPPDVRLTAYAGWTVQQLLNECNSVISGQKTGNPRLLSLALSGINENFLEGKYNGGNLQGEILTTDAPETAPLVITV